MFCSICFFENIANGIVMGGKGGGKGEGGDGIINKKGINGASKLRPIYAFFRWGFFEFDFPLFRS